MSNRVQNIYDKLKEKGIEVYFPDQKVGECKSKYTVVKYAGGNDIAGISSKRDYYDLLLYVPQNQYQNLETYAEEIRTIMKEMWPMLKSTGYASPSFLDTSIKAHMINIQYSNNKKL